MQKPWRSFFPISSQSQPPPMKSNRTAKDTSLLSLVDIDMSPYEKIMRVKFHREKVEFHTRMAEAFKKQRNFAKADQQMEIAQSHKQDAENLRK